MKEKECFSVATKRIQRNRCIGKKSTKETKRFENNVKNTCRLWQCSSNELHKVIVVYSVPVWAHTHTNTREILACKLNVAFARLSLAKSRLVCDLKILKCTRAKCICMLTLGINTSLIFFHFRCWSPASARLFIVDWLFSSQNSVHRNNHQLRSEREGVREWEIENEQEKQRQIKSIVLFVDMLFVNRISIFAVINLHKSRPLIRLPGWSQQRKWKETKRKKNRKPKVVHKVTYRPNVPQINSAR